MANVPVVNDPLELLDLAGEKNGWEVLIVKDDEDMRVIEMQSKHGKFALYVESYVELGQVNFRFYVDTPQNLPEWAIDGVCRLVNLMNEQSVLGRWVFHASGTGPDGSPACLTWEYEILSDLLGDNGDELLASILAKVVVTHEFYYPVTGTFFAAKPKMYAYEGRLHFAAFGIPPEVAMKFLIQNTLSGRA